MKNILVEINCNRCFYNTHIKSHTLVLPDLEPHIRQRILNNTMFTYSCLRCGQKIMYIHPFLYHDKVHKFLLVLNQEDKNLVELQEMYPTTNIRLVKNVIDLKEKILMFEDHFDDQVIDIIKHKLMKKYQDVSHITYRDYDMQSNSLWFTFLFQDERTEVKGIHLSIYKEFQRHR